MAPAVTPSAHRCRHVALFKRVSKDAAGAMAALVALERQPTGIGRALREPGLAPQIKQVVLRQTRHRFQPTTRRQYRLINTCQESHPSMVGMSVISPAQTLSGTVTVNWRSVKVGAVGKSWLRSVVTLKRRLPLERRPCSCMGFRNRCLPYALPHASRSFQARGQP